MNEVLIGAIAGIIGAFAAGLANIIKAVKGKNAVRSQEYEHSENLIKLIKGTDDNKEILNEMRTKLFTLTETQRSFNIMYLRHSILDVYFTYQREKRIPESQYESVLGLYDVYISLGGNSFVHDACEEMKTWERY